MIHLEKTNGNFICVDADLISKVCDNRVSERINDYTGEINNIPVQIFRSTNKMYIRTRGDIKSVAETVRQRKDCLTARVQQVTTDNIITLIFS